MSFFLNPMPAEFRQGWPIDQSALFTINANRGAIGTMMSQPEPYNFSGGNNIFTINFALDVNIPRVQYVSVAINVEGATPAATMASEVVAALNANTVFSDYFDTFLANWPGNGDVSSSVPPPGPPGFPMNNAPFSPGGSPYIVQIYPKRQPQSLSFYVTPCGAEAELQFNIQAPIKQLRTYFARDT